MSDSGVSGVLTDGTGVSSLTVPKVVKDFIADTLLALPAVFIGLNVANLEQALAVPGAIAIGVLDAVIRIAYRAVLKWAQTP